jgi:hypothetical protein
MCCPSLVVRGTFALVDGAVERRDVVVIEDDRLPPDIAPGSYPQPGECRDGEAPPTGAGQAAMDTSAICFAMAYALDEPDIAGRYTVPTAVGAVFRAPSYLSPQNWRFHGCNPDAFGVPSGGSLCIFTPDVNSYPDTAIELTMMPTDGRLTIADAYVGPERGE